MNIYQKLLEVKKDVEFLKKEASGAQYKYNPSSQVLLAVRDKMNELGLFLEMRILKHTVHLKSEGGLKENFTELDLEMIWVNVEKPEERIVIPWAGQGVDARETGLGKSLTYAEKYFLLKQFNIPTDKDDPDAQPENHGKQSQGSKQASTSYPTSKPNETNQDAAAASTSQTGQSGGAITDGQRKMLYAKHNQSLMKGSFDRISDHLGYSITKFEEVKKSDVNKLIALLDDHKSS